MARDQQIREDDLIGELTELKEDMEEDDQIGDDLHFFPEYEGVQGYWGTGPVWFIGSKPSKGHSSFPTNADTLLYETLEQFGFANAHLTDLSKERGAVPENGIPHEEMARMRPYFRREVELLEPEVLVAMSRRVETALKYMAVTDGIEICYIHHYSWANGRGDEAVFLQDVKELAQRFDQFTEE